MGYSLCAICYGIQKPLHIGGRGVSEGEWRSEDRADVRWRVIKLSYSIGKCFSAIQRWREQYDYFNSMRI